MQQTISVRSPKTNQTYKLRWDKPTPPNDSDIDDFLSEVEGENDNKPTAPLQTPLQMAPKTIQESTGDVERYDWDTSLSRFGKGLGERLYDLGEMVVNPVKYVNKQVDNYKLSQIDIGDQSPKSTIGNRPPTNDEALLNVASFAGIPVEKIRHGNYAGAIGEALPDLLLAKGAKVAGKVKPPSYAKTQLAKIAAERLASESAAPRIKPVSSLDIQLPDNLNLKPVESLAAAPTIPVESLTKKLTTELSTAKKVRGKQDILASEERGRRFKAAQEISEQTTGPKGLKQELSALGGKLPKVRFESLEGKFTPEERVSLHETIKNHPKLDSLTQRKARVGLEKLFGEFGGEVPQPKELELLGKVFGDDVVSAIVKHRSLGEKARTVFSKVLGTSKTARTIIDLSFPLRQGLPYIGNKEFHASIVPMIKSAFDPKYFEERQLAIKHRPLYKLGEDAGLDLTDLGTHREEQFVNNYLENNWFVKKKIPGFTHVAGLTKGSNRAFVSFANDLRSSMFDNLVKDTTKMTGAKVDPKTARKIARYLNVTTGRGSLGSLEVAASDLNAALFSPRLLSSRIEMMTNPALYLNSGAAVRKQALRSALAMSSFVGGTAALAKLAGADVTLNPNDSDFMKIRIGNTRLDLAGGFQQPIRLIHQLVSGKYVDSSKTEKDLGSEFFSPTRGGIIGQFLLNKASPAASVGADLLTSRTDKSGQRVTKYGEPLTGGKMATELFMPMIMEDLKELLKEDPSLLYLMAPVTFGGSVQVQKPKKVRAIR